jgi:cytochrome c
MSGLVKYYGGFFIFLFLFESAFGDERQFNLGTIASPSEVAGWNIDVRPDGLGAPIGSGNAFDGEEIYSEKCGFCHGDFGEGIDRWPELVGGEDSLNSHDPIKTTSSYWPYASTMYDYIYRAMPFGEAQSLSADETYSIVAYLLYMGDVIDEEFDVSNDSIGLIEMPNKYGFLLPDPRPDVEGSTKIPCMTNCRGATEVIGSAKDLDVTPEAEG